MAAAAAGLALTGCDMGIAQRAATSNVSSDWDSASGGGTGTTGASSAGDNAQPIPPVDPPASYDLSADVVVCGTGGGLVSALRASELGASVIAIDSSSSWGGSAKETDIFSVMGTEWQASLFENTGLSGALGTDPVAANQFLATTGMPSLEELGVDLATGTLADLLDAALGGHGPEAMRFGNWKQYVGQPGGSKATAAGVMPDGTDWSEIGAPMHVDLDLLTHLINDQPDCMDWMCNQIGKKGVVMGPVTMFGNAGSLACLCPEGAEVGGFVARTNITVFQALYDLSVEAGVDFHFNTSASALIMKDGAVVGVQATDENGSKINIEAKKGVILSTGGMASNMDMLNEYVPCVAKKCLTVSATPNDDGSGIRMGLGAGSEIAGQDSAFIFDGGIECGQWNHYLYKGDVQFARQPGCLLNKKGQRVPYYPVTSYGFTMQAGIHMAQPGGRSYLFTDANYRDMMENSDQLICRKPITKTMMQEAGSNADRLPESVCEHNWEEGFQQGLDGGWIYTADTIEELAEKMGLNPEIIAKAVANWNELCDKGVDEDLHYDPFWLRKVVEPPFYGVAVSGTCLATNTGLSTNASYHVLDTSGVPIPGLWAAGSTMGGQSGASTWGDCPQPGGGVMYTCATNWGAANDIMGVEFTPRCDPKNFYGDL